MFIDEIETAFNTTVNSGIGLNHSLCHGDFGNLDFLFQSLEILRESYYINKYKEILSKVMVSTKNGWLCGTPLNIETPGLMTGLAGIGYGMLRLFAPDKVPSVLSLEFVS
ncbi:lanthionine synthetase LanC family protein [Lihuaxuella thermophila]|uniref:Lanthionine synthetase C-like protein n=1 Tax=Lihuaxuella thermophila TaxID=1173111 RepID=A0A1H8GXU7_9BACL|nr:Lanthionine synthetase C-like protein [Lihuaxuella thermophila]